MSIITITDKSLIGADSSFKTIEVFIYGYSVNDLPEITEFGSVLIFREIESRKKNDKIGLVMNITAKNGWTLVHGCPTTGTFKCTQGAECFRIRPLFKKEKQDLGFGKLNLTP